MTSVYIVIALTLLILGVIGSFIPSVPGPLLSITGVIFYWWSTGYTEPGTISLVLMLSTGLLALVTDWLATFLGAEKAGISRRTGLKAIAVGIILFFISGPLGVVLGIVGFIFVREVLIGKDPETAFKSSVWTGIAFLASSLVKAVLTTIVLMIFALSLIL